MKWVLGVLGSIGSLCLAGCSSSAPADSNSPFSQGGAAAGSAAVSGAPGIAGAGSGGTMSASGGASGGNGDGASGGFNVAGMSAGGAGAAGMNAGGTNAGGMSAGGMSGAGGAPSPSAWPSAACQAKTAGLLAMMTRAEKAAQMVMAGNPDGSPPTVAEVASLAPGAVFSPGGAAPPGGITPQNWAAMVDGYIAAAANSRLAIPILYGVDAVHGMNAASGTVIFPHNIGLGSTKDPALVEQVERVTAQEVAAMGISWTFSPVVSVSWDDRWGRVYESFSEDPTLTGLLSAAATRGLQGAGGLGTGTPGLVGCSKHWAGDGQATAGTSAKGGVVDRGDIRIDEAGLRQYGIAPFLPTIAAGLGSIMVSDATWNKASLSSNKHLVVDILKTELGFKGFVATDWNAADTAGGVPAVVNAGVDMLMQPGPSAGSWKGTITAIATSPAISDARLNDAVTRILGVKCQAGLFGYKRDPALLASVGSADHRAVGRKAVAASLVLLQNNNAVLPLVKTKKVFVTGSGATSLANQCGGWTLAWQGMGVGAMGSSSATTSGTTIAQAIAKAGTVTATQADADVVVVVLSEPPYAEFLGDKASINTLPAADFKAVDDAHAAGKKVVAIVLSGRPVIISDHLANADAWIAAWLPGTEGDGVADILYGTVKPSGKLSHSWPRLDAQPNSHAAGYAPLFALGFGLTYP